jgi:hypothetical protein
VHSLVTSGRTDLLKSLLSISPQSRSALDARDSKGFSPLLALYKVARDFVPNCLCAPEIRSMASPDITTKNALLYSITYPRSKLAVTYTMASDLNSTNWIPSLYQALSGLGKLGYYFNGYQQQAYPTITFAFADPEVPTQGSQNFRISSKHHFALPYWCFLGCVIILSLLVMFADLFFF